MSLKSRSSAGEGIAVREFRDAHTFEPKDFDEFKALLKEPGGFLRGAWCGGSGCETRIKETTKATIRRTVTRFMSSAISNGRNPAVAITVRYSAQRRSRHKPTASVPSTTA